MADLYLIEAKFSKLDRKAVLKLLAELTENEYSFHSFNINYSDDEICFEYSEHDDQEGMLGVVYRFVYAHLDSGITLVSLDLKGLECYWYDAWDISKEYTELLTWQKKELKK